MPEHAGKRRAAQVRRSGIQIDQGSTQRAGCPSVHLRRDRRHGRGDVQACRGVEVRLARRPQAALTLSDLRPLEMTFCGEHESARPVIERLQRLSDALVFVGLDSTRQGSGPRGSQKFDQGWRGRHSLQGMAPSSA